jgi:hypothetical protein
VVWAGLLEEPLEVVRRRHHLMLVAMRGGHNTPHTGSACPPHVAIVMLSHGHGPLKALLRPLLAALDALLSTADRDNG